MTQRLLTGGIAITLFLLVPSRGLAAEHASTEQAGEEPDAQTMMEPEGSAMDTSVAPSAEAIRRTIGDYITQVEQEEGSFTVDDDVTGQTRTLTLQQVHDRVGKIGSFYYACTDMRDTASGEALDLDFDVEATEDGLEVVDMRIHQVNGTPRYTYNEHHERIPLKAGPSS